LFSFLAEILQPINCVLISEDIPSITIVLSERRESSLQGKIFKDEKGIGNFYTRKPNKENSASWSFESNNVNFNGEIILFKDQELWNRYQNKIKANQVNRALFSNLSLQLSKITNDIDVLKGTSGFFKIGNQCNGGKINKVFHKTKDDSFAIL
tara:strand:- start:771 stop:1229 length:459 start_codon:yes stop_codon:yes gene_type:complete